MDPVLGGEVVERQQIIDVVGDLLHRLGELRAVGLLEHRDGLERVLLVFRVADLLQGLLRSGLGGLRQAVEHVCNLVNPAPLVPGLGEHLGQVLPEPEAPSPTARAGTRMPRRQQSRSRSAQEIERGITVKAAQPDEVAPQPFVEVSVHVAPK